MGCSRRGLVTLPWLGCLQGCHFVLLQGRASGLRRLQFHLPAKPVAGKEQQQRGEVLEGGEQWIPSIIRMAASSLMQIGGRRRLFAAGSVEEGTERWSCSPWNKLPGLNKRCVVNYTLFFCPEKIKPGALQDKQSLVGVRLLSCVAHSCKLTQGALDKSNFMSGYSSIPPIPPRVTGVSLSQYFDSLMSIPQLPHLLRGLCFGGNAGSEAGYSCALLEFPA